MIAWPWLAVAVVVGALFGLLMAGLCRCAARGDQQQ